MVAQVRPRTAKLKKGSFRKLKKGSFRIFLGFCTGHRMGHVVILTISPERFEDLKGVALLPLSAKVESRQVDDSVEITPPFGHPSLERRGVFWGSGGAAVRVC